MNEESIKQPAILKRIEVLDELIEKLGNKLMPIISVSPEEESVCNPSGESLAMGRLATLCTKVEILTSAIDIN